MCHRLRNQMEQFEDKPLDEEQYEDFTYKYDKVFGIDRLKVATDCAGQLVSVFGGRITFLSKQG